MFYVGCLCTRSVGGIGTVMPLAVCVMRVAACAVMLHVARDALVVICDASVVRDAQCMMSGCALMV